MARAIEYSQAPYRMASVIALAWLGMYVHNAADLPNLTVSSPVNVLPGLVWLCLLVLWWTIPGTAWPARLLLAWGLLNLVGGFATVLPLPIWPFKPEQSARHYAFHVLYAFAQLPLLALVRNELRPVTSSDWLTRLELSGCRDAAAVTPRRNPEFLQACGVIDWAPSATLADYTCGCA